MKDKDLEYYVVRNERIPELVIYSFEAGERFESDFLLFARKKNNEGNPTYQEYVEAKGTHLLEKDSWKEDFSMQIKDNHKTMSILSNEYKIIGFPFFNKENKIDEFEKAIISWIENM